MTYIKTGINKPGIIELLFYKGATGKALSNLAHTLLHGPSGLNPGERELIAAYVSKLNNCEFCCNSHTSAMQVHLNGQSEAALDFLRNNESVHLSEKLIFLLKIAEKVRMSGTAVLQTDIDFARKSGATDEDIHDTILIAAAFCMFNRYVDGLGTEKATAQEYQEMGQRMAKGYKYPPLFLRKFVLRLMK
ncbi:MAG: carboxymuconolactone decarboxylase family protein [Bacteroidetes bacterium]|jgi:uncharacterized peroxidase-related enzyme|nr:carboxymuconolactone decarboxylase family protein [Bacteroidota bacterium]MBK9319016.1 carboxymuconolactone decarboxylase family protein [Bacteroidota bacterium]